MTARQQQAMGIFVGQGYDPKGGASIVGALSGESGINLDATINRVNADHGSGGIAEWRLDRKDAMVSFVTALGKPAEDLEGQCLFVINELKHDYPNLDAELRSGAVTGKDTVGAITTMCWNFVKIFERPNMAVAHMDDIRVPQALKVYNAYIAANHRTVPPVATGGAVIGTAAGGGAIATAGQVPSWVTIVMALFSAISYLVTAFNVKTAPTPLPIPDIPEGAPASTAVLTPMEEFKRDDALAKAALAQRQKSLDKLKALAEEIQEITSHETVTVIDHAPPAIAEAAK